MFSDNNFEIINGNISSLIKNNPALIILAAPSRDFLAGEISQLKKYRESGGNMLLFIEPSVVDFPLLNGFIKEWGIIPGDELVCEEQAYTNNNPINIVPMYAPHKISRYFMKTSVFLTMSSTRSLYATQNPGSAYDVRTVLNSSHLSYGKTGYKFNNLEKELIPLTNYFVGDISALAVINNKNRFGLIHGKESISLEPANPGDKISQEKLQSFIFRVSKLNAMASVKDVQDKNQFGLTNPLAQITIIPKDGEKTRLFLGNISALNNSYYMESDSDQQIYLISEEESSLFLADWSEFSDSRLLPSQEPGDLNALSSVEFIYKNQINPSFRIINNGDFTFSLTKPVISSLDYEKVLSDLVFPLLSLNLPRTEADTESLPYINLHYMDLLNDSLYHCNISEIQNMIINDNESGKEYNLQFKGESVNINGNMNGIELSYPQIMEFYDTIVNTGLSGRIEHTKQINRNEKTSVSLQVFKKNGSIDQLDYSLPENGEVILFINGTADFTTYNKTVLGIQKALSDLLHKDGT